MSLQQDAKRLEEIQREMEELLDEALSLIPTGTRTRAQAEAYWYPTIEANLGTGSEMTMGGTMFSMQDAINDLEEY